MLSIRNYSRSMSRRIATFQANIRGGIWYHLSEHLAASTHHPTNISCDLPWPWKNPCGLAYKRELDPGRQQDTGSPRLRLLVLLRYANLNYCAVVRTKWECVCAYFGTPERLPVGKELA